MAEAYVTENTIEKREKRIADVVALREPDRVPFAPKVNLIYAQAGGIDAYEAMTDLRNMKQGVVNFLSKYESDLFWTPAAYPINVMEVLDTKAVNWPGASRGLPLTEGFQITDITYMEEDEYDEFLHDPTRFFIKKIFPRRHGKLQGLKKANFSNVIELGHYGSMSSFADPEVRESLLKLMFAGEEAQKWLDAQGMLNETALSMQCPLGCTVGQSAPYDLLADNVRGYLNLPMDIFEIPDKVKAAIDVMAVYASENVHNIKAMGLKYVFMPLHGGTDDFMSDETYREFYWPTLRALIEEIISLGMTPYIFWEGKYNTRLEVLKELPAKKCIFMFEQVDIVKAKKVLGETACITGNLPGSTLVYGKKEEIVEETKRLLDTCAPGGGFIMDCSIVMDHYKEENMEAWYETTMKYGKY